MRTLLIDNYDSYTYNLFQILAEVNGALPIVRYNDEISLDQIQAMLRSGAIHNVVISPGPGTPSEPKDIGVCLDVLAHLADTPILGVCLGHQALALVHGAAVARSPEPVHGRLSACVHSGHPLFGGVPSGGDFQVVRYHSLAVVESSLPETLRAVCWTSGCHSALRLQGDADASASHGGGGSADPQAPSSDAAGRGGGAGGGAPGGTGLGHVGPGPGGPSPAPGDELDAHQRRRRWGPHDPGCGGSPGQDGACSSSGGGAGGAGQRGLVMGLAHASRPHYGVQFHPESVATRYGVALLANFRDLSCDHLGLPRMGRPSNAVGPPGKLPPLMPWPAPPPPRRPAPATLQPSSNTRPGALPAPCEQPETSTSYAGSAGSGSPPPGAGSPPLRVAWRRCAPGALTRAGGPLALFEGLYGFGPDTWWLDSAATDRGRYSYMGGRGGPLWQRLTYRLPPPPPAAAAGGAAAAPPPLGTLAVEARDGSETVTQIASFFDHLAGLVSERRLCAEAAAGAALELPGALNLWGGLVGYLGYELKAECGGANAHASSTPDAVMWFADRLVALDLHTQDVYLLALYDGAEGGGQRARAAVPPPTSSNGNGSSSGNGCSSSGSSEALAQRWLDDTELRVQALAAAVAAPAAAAAGGQPAHALASAATAAGTLPPTLDHLGAQQVTQHEQQQQRRRACTQLPLLAPASAPQLRSPEQANSRNSNGHAGRNGAGGVHAPHAASANGSQSIIPASNGSGGAPFPYPFQLVHDRGAYLANISACREALFAGESYEVCLTTALRRTASVPPPAALYRTLRRVNPAPYAAWLQCGPQGPSVCCSSPERFLRGDRGGLLEARPIKGTAARHPGDPAADAAAAARLAASEKERAENLMIVDLLRNDLGRVCQVGSVHVPGLMEIESYASVHQMVSTVRGLRKADVAIIDCIRAAFPGGSMTGAPKVRTMEIIDSLEGRARGVYSGCIGFIGVNDTFDLNIVIRTAVVEQLQQQQQQHPQEQEQGGEGPSGGGGGVQPAAVVVSVGAGGAIVVQSDPGAEYEEMLLKSRALVRAVALCGAAEAGAGAGVAAAAGPAAGAVMLPVSH